MTTNWPHHRGPQHPQASRRDMLRAGAIGLLGLGMNHVSALRALAGPAAPLPKARAAIFIFLSGGLSQLDSFDPKTEMRPTASAASSASRPLQRPACKLASTYRCLLSAVPSGRWSAR